MLGDLKSYKELVFIGLVSQQGVVSNFLRKPAHETRGLSADGLKITCFIKTVFTEELPVINPCGVAILSSLQCFTVKIPYPFGLQL